MLTTLPFSGFYNSRAIAELDTTLERFFSDDNGDVNDSLHYKAQDVIDWQAVYVEYAQAYVQNFSSEFKIPMAFESLVSPREYNFSTDRIFAEISLAEVLRVLIIVDRDIFTEVCEEKFTSRSGFMSSYSNDWQEWGETSTWDHNQVGTLLEAYARQQTTDGFDSFAEYHLMEDDFCNGRADEWLYAGNGKAKLQRLDKIWTYLKERAER